MSGRLSFVSGVAAPIVFCIGVIFGLCFLCWKIDEDQRKDADFRRQQHEERVANRSTPYFMGYDAYKAGLGIESNPYGSLTQHSYVEWQRGYQQSKIDGKERPK